LITQNDTMTSALVRIEPKKGWSHLNVGEVWRYRELLYFFIWRDLKVRYKQTLLGIAWAVLQPLFSALVFTIFFGRLARVSSDGVPYVVFSYVALVPWIFFANGLTLSANCLVTSANMLKKVYFPRLTLPVATVVSGLVDLAVAMVLMFVIMLFHHRHPSARIIWLPGFLLLALVASVGCGLWLSALNVKYRDIRYVVPFLVQLWLFATPVVYSSSLLHEPWHSLFGLNPMVAVVEGFRWATLGTNVPIGKMAAISGAATISLAVSGLIYFRRVERTFADIV
jgi:homopolymeric O-antigen transport system permease protein